MINPIEKLIYFIRDILWKYPDFIFFSKNSLVFNSLNIYSHLRPLSHFVLSTIIVVLIAGFILSDVSKIVRANEAVLIEGVIVGVDENGNKNTIQKVNPLVLTNIQLEKDLSEIIYEPLVDVRQSGEVVNVLVETIAANDRGDNYRIKLRENVFWHDGSKLTAKDVKATFDLLERLDIESSTKTIYSTVANKRIKFIPIEGDDYRFDFQLEGVIPNFYELISFKILPAKYIEELNSRNIFSSSQFINSNPIGVGMYKLDQANSEEIVLVRNENYYDKNRIPKIEKIIFRFFIDEENISKSLINGQIHSVAGLTSNSLRTLKSERNIRVNKTDVIYNQYYALYFNLGDNGSEIIKNNTIRKAISSAINRNYIISVLEDEAKEALGPISQNSFAFEQNITRYTYNFELANKLLDEEGWIKAEGEEYRSKEGKLLEFEMLAIDNIDRNKVSDSIVEDLKSVGIKMNLIKKTNAQLISENILSRNYQTLLYSMTTFTDPDRYELFHSNQIQHPGLNISSFVSAEKTVEIVDVVVDGQTKKEKQTIAEVDFRLEKGRGILDETERKKHYFEFQRMIAEEIPAVFLYHPILNYSTNKRIRNVDISNAKSLEERFDTIYKWEIQL